jgi:uncharacterized protein
MISKVEKLLQNLVLTINATDSVERIILFGSRARGDAENRSDIDIAIVAPNITELDWLKILERIDNLETLLKIDVVSFPNASKELQNEILREGKIIYERHKNTKNSTKFRTSFN